MWPLNLVYLYLPISKHVFSLIDGKEIQVESLENDDMKKIYLEAFKSIAKIHKSFFKEDSTDDEIENLAKECESTEVVSSYGYNKKDVWFGHDIANLHKKGKTDDVQIP